MEKNNMKCIVAVDRNWGIGRDGSLLLRVPADMKRFREITTGHVIVMGRKTLQSFPQGQVLPDRVNIVLTRNPSFQAKGAVIVHDTDALMHALQPYEDEEIYVIGGGQIYGQLLPMCDTCLVTAFDRVYDADTFFPALDGMPEWKLTDESDEQVYFDTTYTFRTYQRIK